MAETNISAAIRGSARPPNDPHAGPQTLIEAWRSTYPGAYDDLADATLDKMIRAKFSPADLKEKFPDSSLGPPRILGPHPEAALTPAMPNTAQPDFLQENETRDLNSPTFDEAMKDPKRAASYVWEQLKAKAKDPREWALAGAMLFGPKIIANSAPAWSRFADSIANAPIPRIGGSIEPSDVVGMISPRSASAMRVAGKFIEPGDETIGAALTRTKYGISKEDAQMFTDHIQNGMKPETAAKIIGENDPRKISGLMSLYVRGKNASK